jgi:catechol-2,3-dioxygenase
LRLKSLGQREIGLPKYRTNLRSVRRFVADDSVNLLLWAADRFFQTALYYADPDQNILELNTNNFPNDWTVTEQLRNLPSQMHLNVDPEKMIAARSAGASPWQVHQRDSHGSYRGSAELVGHP